MTGQQIIDHFRFITDDTDVSPDRELILLNNAYDRINTRRYYQGLLTTDISNTIVENLKTYTLPTDFQYYRAARFFDVANDRFDAPVRNIPFQMRDRFHNQIRFSYIDLVNNQIVLTYKPSSADSGKRFDIDYQLKPLQLTISTEPWFDRAFHQIMVFEMSRLFWQKEQDEKSRSWHRENNAEYIQLKEDLENWDTQLDAGLNPDFQPRDSWIDLENNYGFAGSEGHCI